MSRALALAALVHAACGGKSAPPITCGPGTHEAGGQCVLDDWVRADVDARVQRGAIMVRADQQLRMLSLLKQAERVTNDPDAAAALNAADPDERRRKAALLFARFKVDAPMGDPLPDVFALVDADGTIIAMDGLSNPPAKQWSKPGGGSVVPALDVVLAHAGDVTSMAELFVMDHIPMRVGAAAIVGADESVRGAVVLGYAITADELRRGAAGAGADLALVDGGTVYASSAKDAKAGDELAAALRGAKPEESRSVHVSTGGHDAEAIAVVVPRFANRPLPPSVPPITMTIVVVGRTLGPDAHAH